MENKIIVLDEEENEIKIEVILGFEIEELNKKYIAYTINDNEEEQEVDILISEIKDNQIINIPANEIQQVLEYYNEVRGLI